MQDQAIIRRVQQGDTEAYALLVRRHHRDLLGFIHRLVRDPHLAEDIGQEVFLAAFKALPDFETHRGTPFMAWLYILARNRAVSALRTRNRMRLTPMEDMALLPSQEPAMDAALIHAQERQALAQSLAALDEPFRSTILLSLQGELVEDIALSTGVSQSTVKTRLFRAREKLRRSIAAHFGGVCHDRPL